MKKLISKFGDSLLSREELKRVKGGYNDNCGVCKDYIVPKNWWESTSYCFRPSAPPGVSNECICSTGGGCEPVIA